MGELERDAALIQALQGGERRRYHLTRNIIGKQEHERIELDPIRSETTHLSLDFPSSVADESSPGVGTGPHL